MMQTPELPPFDYQPQPYRGPSAEEVLRLRRQFLNPGTFPLLQTTVDDRGGQSAIRVRRTRTPVS